MYVPWWHDVPVSHSMPTLLLASTLFGTGVMLLLFGWHVYRICLSAVGVLLGGAVGAGIAGLLGAPWVVFALPLGVLTGLLAARLQKVGAFLVGGLCSAVWILSIASFEGSVIGLYVAAGLAFLVTGILAVLIWRPMVVVSFAVLGAWFLGNALLLGADTFSPGVLRRLAVRHPAWAAGIMGLMAAIGIVFQMREKDDSGAVRDRPKR